MNQHEHSIHMMRRAPEDSEEFWYFHRAAHYYEQRDCCNRGSPQASSAGMKASRAYKKGIKLFTDRVG